MNKDGSGKKYGEIAAVVGEIRVCIEEHRDYLSGGHGSEARTRTFLIDRLLRSVGWEVLDPSQVQLEYPSGPKARVDYVLQTSGIPRVIVEAKSLGIRQKRDALDQLYDYMDVDSLQTVSIGVLTDGDEWHIYRRGKRREAHTIKVTAATDNHAVAIFLDDHLARSKFESKMPSLDDWETHCQHPVPPDDVQNVERIRGDWIGLDDDSFDPTGLKPSRLRLYDGSEAEIGSWRELIVTIGKRLVKDGKLVAAHCPIATGEGSATSVANVEPKHHGGARSGRYDWVDIGGGVWCWASQKATGKLSRTRTLLRFCGVEVGAVQFQLSQD